MKTLHLLGHFTFGNNWNSFRAKSGVRQLESQLWGINILDSHHHIPKSWPKPYRWKEDMQPQSVPHFWSYLPLNSFIVRQLQCLFCFTLFHTPRFTLILNSQNLWTFQFSKCGSECVISITMYFLLILLFWLHLLLGLFNHLFSTYFLLFFLFLYRPHCVCMHFC